MPGLIYLLCALTSFLCAVLLLNGFRNNSVRLLLWSGICFLAMTLDNVILFMDRIVFPAVDFSMVRTMPGLIGLIVLLYGLVWDAK